MIFEDNELAGDANQADQNVECSTAQSDQSNQDEPLVGEVLTGESEDHALDAENVPAVPDWEAESKRFEDLYLRAVAELENARRRFQKEKEENARYASESVIKDIIPVLDNLYLALSYASTEDPAVKNLAEGVSMTIKSFLDRLSDRGLKEIEVKRGTPFDPNVHEAIGQEVDQSIPDKSISRLVSRGYTLHQRLLRPAKVMVAKNEAVQ
jgi:molecular chaperone GrpE